MSSDGSSSCPGTTSGVCIQPGSVTDRMKMTFDANGNRTEVVYDPE
jgi:hypothetical protein